MFAVISHHFCTGQNTGTGPPAPTRIEVTSPCRRDCATVTPGPGLASGPGPARSSGLFGRRTRHGTALVIGRRRGGGVRPGAGSGPAGPPLAPRRPTRTQYLPPGRVAEATARPPARRPQPSGPPSAGGGQPGAKAAGADSPAQTAAASGPRFRRVTAVGDGP